MAWRRVATAADLERQSVLAVEVGGEEIALYWVEGAPYATSNICTHAFARLTDGFLDGECVECPIHQAMFNVKSGDVIAGPAEAPIKTYPCRIDGADVVVDL